MRLKFYILWFENEKEWAESKTDSIREIVEEHGFEWVPPRIYKKQGEFSGDYNDYDMILMDYVLAQGREDGGTGANIIESVRKKECLTTILFYSQFGERKLREEIANRFLDGVFCAGREDFLDRFESLFVSNIKKIEDVNNLRGLVMAETADLENIKEEIINIYESLDSPEKKEIIEKSVQRLLQASRNCIGFLESTNNLSFNHIMYEKPLLDLTKKSMIIHSINVSNQGVCNFEHRNFNEEIILKRNLLAHVKEKIIGNPLSRKIVLESERNGQILIFSQEEAKKIRKDISKYRKELEKLREYLKED